MNFKEKIKLFKDKWWKIKNTKKYTEYKLWNFIQRATVHPEEVLDYMLKKLK